MPAIRMFFSWMTEKGVLAMNPAREVQTAGFSRREDKTPAFKPKDVQKVPQSIDTKMVDLVVDRQVIQILELRIIFRLRER
jgi:site-specific recombinase XerC